MLASCPLSHPSPQHQSCNEVCEARGMICNAKDFWWLNSCAGTEMGHAVNAWRTASLPAIRALVPLSHKQLGVLLAVLGPLLPCPPRSHAQALPLRARLHH